MPPPMTAAPMAAKSIFSRSVIVSALHQCRGVLACCVNVAQIPSEYAGSAPEGVTFKNSMPESHGCSLSRRTRRRKLSGGPERVPSRRMRFFSTTVSAAGTKWELCIPDRLTISCSEVTMSGRVSGVGRVLVAPRRRRVSSRRALSPSISGWRVSCTCIRVSSPLMSASSFHVTYQSGAKQNSSTHSAITPWRARALRGNHAGMIGRRMLHQPQRCDEGEDFRIRLLLFHNQGQNHRGVLQLAEEFRKLGFALEHVARHASGEHGDGAFFGFGWFLRAAPRFLLAGIHVLERNPHTRDMDGLGGDGGEFGHIILRGNRNYWTLLHLKYDRHAMAGHGESGSKGRSFGKDGADKIIEVPCGTVVYNAETGEYLCDVTEDGQEVILLKGGRGGQGNWHFKTATRQAPRFAQPGEPMQEMTVIMELKLLADVGLVGFPNAGKSTLLSSISAAKPKIADYPFTTLEPNLGIVSYHGGKSFVMADIPGIIEGASQGKGLGLRFLRHIERNSLLLFMVPADSDDIRKEYEVLLNELRTFNPEMLDKQRVLAVTKSDMLDQELMDEIEPTLPEGIPHVFISSVSGLGISVLKDILWEELNKESNKIEDIVHRPKDVTRLQQELKDMGEDEDIVYEYEEDVDDDDDIDYEYEEDWEEK